MYQQNILSEACAKSDEREREREKKYTYIIQHGIAYIHIYEKINGNVPLIYRFCAGKWDNFRRTRKKCQQQTEMEKIVELNLYFSLCLRVVVVVFFFSSANRKKQTCERRRKENLIRTHELKKFERKNIGQNGFLLLLLFFFFFVPLSWRAYTFRCCSSVLSLSGK